MNVRNKLECLSLENHLQSGLMFVCKAPLKQLLSRIDSWTYSKNQTRLESLTRTKHSSFLRTVENYGLKKLYNVGPLCSTHVIITNMSQTSLKNIFGDEHSSLFSRSVSDKEKIFISLKSGPYVIKLFTAVIKVPGHSA